MTQLTIDDRTVTYVEHGSGQTIVLLHAGAGSGKQWAKTAPFLQSHFRLIAPDLWGFGATDPWRGEHELTHDDQALLVSRVVKATCPDSVHLVGHSYGGATAVRLVLGRRLEVLTLTLIEPILTPLLDLAGESALFTEYHDMASAFMNSVATGDPNSAWRGFLNYRKGPGTWERLSSETKARFLSTTENTVAGFRSNLSNPTSINDLATISLPTLVMCGEKTTLPDRKVTEILRQHLPRCTYDLIPGAEHMSPLTHPQYIASAIEHHIATAAL